MTRRPLSVGERWSIVLAGGEGTRLSRLTVSRYGEHRPKQYCAFLGDRTMYDHTLARAVAFSGPQRVVTVIGRGHMRFFDDPRAQLSGYVVEQPSNCDTAPGVFLPLAYVLAFDPEATVTVYPSDHFIRPNDRFLAYMHRAAAIVERLENKLVLVSAVADAPEPEYGWIQTGLPEDGGFDARRVVHFLEKPSEAEAADFFRRGFLWNTLNMAFKARTLWELGRSFHPEMIERLERLMPSIGTPAEGAALAQAYERMPSVNFSKGILERAVDRTLALPMAGVEWSDWGRPERIADTLAGLGRERAPIEAALEAPIAHPRAIAAA